MRTAAPLADSGAQYLSRERQVEYHAQAAGLAIGELNPAAMRFGDFARERESQARAAPFSRIKRQQRLREHRRIHAGTPVAYLDALRVAERRHFDFDGVRGAARFVGILEQVEQRLFDLAGVEPARRLGQSRRDTKRRPSLILPRMEIPPDSVLVTCLSSFSEDAPDADNNT